MTEIRKGQAPAPLTRTQFRERFNLRDYNPAFDTECGAIARLEDIAWEAMQDGRCSAAAKLDRHIGYYGLYSSSRARSNRTARGNDHR